MIVHYYLLQSTARRISALVSLGEQGTGLPESLHRTPSSDPSELMHCTLGTSQRQSPSPWLDPVKEHNLKHCMFYVQISTMMGYEMNSQESGMNLSRGRKFSLLQGIHTGPGIYSVSLPMGIKGSFPQVKW
jgi:hypothetical protein